MEQEYSLPLVIEYFSIFSLLGGKKKKKTRAAVILGDITVT